MARVLAVRESQEGSRAEADEDNLRMAETETAGAPGDRGAVRGPPGDKGAVRGAPGDRGEEVGDVPEVMPGPVCPPVRRSRGWRPTPPVSGPAGRGAEKWRDAQQIISDLSL